MTQNGYIIHQLEQSGFVILNDAPRVLVCKLEPIGPELDDGRWLDLSINEERCSLLQQIGTIVNVAVMGIGGRKDEKPHLFIEVRKRAQQHNR